MRLIKNGFVVNENKIEKKDILIDNDKIVKIADNIIEEITKDLEIIDATNRYIFPGLIDTHVHFREPGLTHKEDIKHGSKGAIYSGITTIFDMPNTNPPTLSFEAVEEKCKLAEKNCLSNYSFFIGVDENNLDEVINGNYSKTCGIKLFMGSSTGNMALKNQKDIEELFKNAKVPIVIHSEDDEVIAENAKKYIDEYGEDVPMSAHSIIRDDKACYKSTKVAVDLAKKYGTKIHIAHLSSKIELELFENKKLEEKNITVEACVHHLFFQNEDFDKLGAKIKCNPSIKFEHDKNALVNAVSTPLIDSIATDHAPHATEEKQNKDYFKNPSGIPIIENSLYMVLSLYHKGLISLETIVEKMAHNPAKIFKIKERGFLREGYFADIAIVDLNKEWKKETVISKCGWSPLLGETFKGKVVETIVNGKTVLKDEKFVENIFGERVEFEN